VHTTALLGEVRLLRNCGNQVENQLENQPFESEAKAAPELFLELIELILILILALIHLILDQGWVSPRHTRNCANHTSYSGIGGSSSPFYQLKHLHRIKCDDFLKRAVSQTISTDSTADSGLDSTEAASV
jgi:hypothetical protein